MDFWRHISSGRLSEMFGSSQVDTDRYLRTRGWTRVAQQEIQEMNAEMKAYLEVYADGVNAYLAEHQGSALSLEYTVLKFLNPGSKYSLQNLITNYELRITNYFNSFL